MGLFGFVIQRWDSAILTSLHFCRNVALQIRSCPLHALIGSTPDGEETKTTLPEIALADTIKKATERGFTDWQQIARIIDGLSDPDNDFPVWTGKKT